MSKRLQVVFDESELNELRDAASRAEMSVSEWVRRTLREARRNEPQGGIDGKLRAVRAAARHSFPTADIDEMLAEVERGYASPAPE